MFQSTIVRFAAVIAVLMGLSIWTTAQLSSTVELIRAERVAALDYTNRGF